MANIAYERTGDCFVVVRGPGEPTDVEFEWYLATIENALKEGMPPRCLVLTQGGAPSPEQRGELARRLSIVEGAVKVAVLASSTHPRDVAAAVASSRPGYRVFEREDLPEALAFLGVRPAAEPGIRATLERLQANVA
jgi:hypothetical protein